MSSDFLTCQLMPGVGKDCFEISSRLWGPDAGMVSNDNNEVLLGGGDDDKTHGRISTVSPRHDMA